MGLLNLYYYCGNSPVSYADPSGADWTIDIDVFKPRQHVCNSSPEDTVVDLAKKIFLDPSDFRQWLQPSPGLSRPAGANVSIGKAGQRFTVPHTVYFAMPLDAWDVLGLTSFGIRRARSIASDRSYALLMAGYKVTINFSQSSVDFQKAWTAADTWGILYAGHGEPDGTLSLDRMTDPAIFPKPHQLFADLELIACDTADHLVTGNPKSAAWENYISVNGYFRGVYGEGHFYWMDIQSKGKQPTF